MPTKTVYRFPRLALNALERSLDSLNADVVAYPSLFSEHGVAPDSNVLVIVALPDANIPELVRALLAAKQDANHVPSLPEML